MPDLIAEQVSFGFTERPLLHDVGLTLHSGELIVCLGANASGKTTLLRLLSGLLVPRSGHIRVQGARSSHPRNQVGLLFQNPDHQMMADTVEAEIALGLELRGTDPVVIRRTVESLLSRFKLERFRSHSPQALSGGQKQRVALASIMASGPRFLLLDEPDSYLDAPSRRELMNGVDEVRRDCGMLWTTPHPRRMPEADKYFVLDAGCLEQRSRAEILAIANPVRAPL